MKKSEAVLLGGIYKNLCYKFCYKFEIKVFMIAVMCGAADDGFLFKRMWFTAIAEYEVE